jgi:DNA-binding PadR family transcriptional regulator
MRNDSSMFAILGMLSIQPMSGYDIRKEIGESIGYFWREGYGRIYPSLKQLEAKGLIARREGARGKGRQRQAYSLTAKGGGKLRDWLALRPQAQAPRNELLLKLFFGRLAPDAAIRRHVALFGDEQRVALETYRAWEKELRNTQSNRPDLAYWLAAVSYGRHLSQALADWSDETLGVLGWQPKASTRKAKAR